MWNPPGDAGRIVSTCMWRDTLIVACEHAVYALHHEGDDVTAHRLEDADAPPRRKVVLGWGRDPLIR